MLARDDRPRKEASRALQAAETARATFVCGLGEEPAELFHPRLLVALADHEPTIA